MEIKQKEELATTADDKKKIEKVISGTAKTRKKNGFRKFVDNFIGDDVPNIKTYVVKDIVVPTIKKIISETVDTVLFGKSRKGTSTTSRVSYRSYYEEPRPRTPVASDKPVYNYDEIILETRGDAERVLTQMNDILDAYERVSVADLYELVDLPSNYTDNNYGWTSLRTADVMRVSDGYLLRLPKAVLIK